MQVDRLSEDVWQLSAASVLGKGHADSNLPNQDAVAVVTTSRGDVVCAVVSDGAGTATRSGEGSRIAADLIAAHLCLVGERHSGSTISIEAFNQQLVKSVELVRQRLQSLGGSLRDFHCTLVLWLSTPTASFIAQIGDSVALSTRFAWTELGGSRQIDYFPDDRTRLYEVERGQYANETHFLTEPDWQQHLRVTQLHEQVDAVVLMTDGAMDIATLKGAVFRGFLSNLVGKLMSTPDRGARNGTIHAWLDDPQTYGVTGDDKTLLVAVRQRQRSIAKGPVYVGQSPAQAAAAATASTPSRLPMLDAGAAPTARAEVLPAAPARTGHVGPDGPADLGDSAARVLVVPRDARLVPVLLGVIALLCVALISLGLVFFRSGNTDHKQTDPRRVSDSEQSSKPATPRIPAIAEQKPEGAIVAAKPSQGAAASAPIVSAAPAGLTRTPDAAVTPQGEAASALPPVTLRDPSPPPAQTPVAGMEPDRASGATNSDTTSVVAPGHPPPSADLPKKARPVVAVWPRPMPIKQLHAELVWAKGQQFTIKQIRMVSPGAVIKNVQKSCKKNQILSMESSKCEIWIEPNAGARGPFEVLIETEPPTRPEHPITMTFEFR